MEVKLSVISLLSGEKLRENILKLKNAQAYFEYIRHKNNRPEVEVMNPILDSGYGLDNLGKLVKDGEFIYDKDLKLVKGSLKSKK